MREPERERLPMTTVRLRRDRRPLPDLRVLIAVTSAAALVLILALSPSASSASAGALFSSLSQPGQIGFIAAHRGGQEVAPENTLTAFRLAIESGVEVLETDVQLTSDGVPVLFHDWTLDRTTDGTGPVWNIDFESLRQLDAGAGERVPTLTEFLELLAPSGRRAMIELKGSWTAEQAALVTDEITSFGLGQMVLLASFDIVTLASLQEVAPGIPRLMIARRVVTDPQILADLTGAIGIVTSKGFLLSDPTAVDRIHAAGLGVLIYTLNDEDAWEQAVALGVDGIITDRAAQLSSWLEQRAAEESAESQGMDSLN